MLITASSAILGVLFHEAIRIYRCMISGKKIIPNSGLNSKANVLIYSLVILVFAGVAFVLAGSIAGDNPIAAFVFGVNIQQEPTC